MTDPANKPTDMSDELERLKTALEEIRDLDHEALWGRPDRDSGERPVFYTFDATEVRRIASEALATLSTPSPQGVERIAEMLLSAFLSGRGSTRSTRESPTMDHFRAMAREALSSLPLLSEGGLE